MAGYDALDVARINREETMNKTFVVSVVVMFVVSMIVGFVVHGALLGAQYAALSPQMFRGEQDQTAHFGYMIAAHVVMAIGLTWTYRQGRENKPFLWQGVRFGLAVAVLATIPTYLIYFAVQPMPSDLVALQIVFGTIAMVIMGIAVAAVNRDPVPARA
jgi:drug/metabolite transporter (DMT)-like permease